MKELIKKLPLPIAGLMLGLSALGNLIGPYSPKLRIILGSISGLIFILLSLKAFMFPKSIKEGLDNPIIASIMATFPMGMMILSTYIKAFAGQLAFGFWLLALIMNIAIILIFTKKYILNFNIKKVFASYFVLYVGIVVGSVTAPAYNLINIGQFIFWYGLTVYLPLIPIVAYRVFVIKGIPEPALPITIIFAAPASLLLAGYMSSFTEKNLTLITFLTGLALIMTAYALIIMPKMLKLKFYPSYSAFTFPFVISAIALNMTNKYLISINKSIPLLNYVAKFEIIWAIIMVLYVLIAYMKHMIKVLKPLDNPQLDM